MKAKLNRTGKKRTHKVLKRSIIGASVFSIASLSVILPLSLNQKPLEEEVRDIYEQAFSGIEIPPGHKNIIYFLD